MGIYINPHDDKDAFEKASKIKKAGVEVDRESFLNHTPGDKGIYGVAIVDAGLHIAAGVAHNKDEAIVMADPRDYRSREYVFITLDEIKKLDPGCAVSLMKLASNKA